MVEWNLHGEDSSGIELVAVLDESRHVVAGGDSIAPLLQVQLTWERWVDGARRDARDRVVAASLSLFPNNGTMFSPWVQTGLVPLRSNYLLSVPLTHRIIEEITKKASTSSDNAVMLSLSVVGLVRSVDGTNMTVLAPSGPQVLHIHAIQWRKFLTTWGYPSTRFLEVPVNLPEALSSGNDETQRLWHVCLGALSSAHNKWAAHDVHGAGAELRTAIQFALFTWDSIWFPGEAQGEDHWSDAATRIGSGIPGYDQKSKAIPPRSKPDAQRVFSRLQLLRSLNTTANAFHHVGEKPVYMPEDVDTLLTSATALLRGLPAFWGEYPEPLETAREGQ